MKKQIFMASMVALALVSCNQKANKTEVTDEQTIVQPAPPVDSTTEQNGVYFISPKDGEVVKSPVVIEMGVKGMEVEAAGELHEGKGHHHLIIDEGYVAKGSVVAKDEKHIHYGKGETSDTIQLSPGAHTLTLQFADGLHQSYGKDWSKTISVTVQ